MPLSEGPHGDKKLEVPEIESMKDGSPEQRRKTLESYDWIPQSVKENIEIHDTHILFRIEGEEIKIQLIDTLHTAGTFVQVSSQLQNPISFLPSMKDCWNPILRFLGGDDIQLLDFLRNVMHMHGNSYFLPESTKEEYHGLELSSDYGINTSPGSPNTPGYVREFYTL